MAKRALLATPATTRYARYIGRVGALALALGIGTAIATSPGIAWATPESEASDTENAAADGQEAGGPPDTGTPPDGVAGDPTSPTSTVSGLGVTPPDDDDPDDDDPDEQDTAPDTDPPDAGENTDTPPTNTPETTGEPDPSEVDEGSEPDAATTTDAFDTNRSSGSRAQGAATADDQGPASTPQETTADEESASASLANAEAAMFSVSLTATEEVSAAAIPSTAIVAPSPIPPAQVQPQVNPVAAIVRPIVSLALGLFGLAGDPSMPAEPPLGWALLAWVRRQLDETLFNESPTFNFGTITTSQSDDQVISGTVAATDPDDDPLGYRVVDGPANGTVTIDPLTGAFTYTPDEGLAATGGTDTFTVAASELNTETHWHGPIRGVLGALFGIDRGDTAVATVTVTVLNTPPVANDDSETATEDTPTVLTVLDNDSDAEGNPITITGVSTPSSGGTAAVNADGTITYTPGANFTGTDIFTYALNGGDTAGVTITVGAVDDAPTAVDDDTTVTEDTPTPIDVLANDTDVDGGPQQIQSVSDPANGSVVITGDGTGLTYTPGANYTGTDTFTYTLNGGDTATVTVTVSAVDDAPTFNPTFGEPDPVTGVVTGNLGGVDPDSTLVYPAGTVDTAHGKVQINADGSFTYTPTQAARLNAALTPGDDTDSFTVTYDGHDPAVTQTVSVTIDPAQATNTATIAVGTRPNGIAVSPDGTHAYATNYLDESVSVIDTTTNTVTATIPVGNLPAGVAVSPDGTHAYVVNSYDNSVSVIDTTTNTVTATIAVGATPYGIAVSPDGTHAYVVNSSDNSVSVIDTTTNTVTATIAVGVAPLLIAVSPDGSLAYVTNRADYSVSVIDTTTNTVTATIPVGSEPRAVAVSPDGSLAYVTHSGTDTVTILDTTTNTVTATVPVENALGIAFSPDGSLAYIASSTDDTVRILDTTTNTVIATVSVSGNAPVAVAVSHDGSRIYVANGLDSKVSVISIASITTTV